MPLLFWSGIFFLPGKYVIIETMKAQDIFSKLKIDYSKRFAVAVCIGPVPNDPELRKMSYEEKVTAELALFDLLSKLFQNKKRGKEIDRMQAMSVSCAAFRWNTGKITQTL